MGKGRQYLFIKGCYSQETPGKCVLGGEEREGKSRQGNERRKMEREKWKKRGERRKEGWSTKVLGSFNKLAWFASKPQNYFHSKNKRCFSPLAWGLELQP